MLFHSTRNSANKLLASKAIIEGLAPDKGLYVPEYFPKLNIEKILHKNYAEIAQEIISMFFDDFSYEEVGKMIKSAYTNKFDDPAITPVKFINGQKAFLELWHGPTLAFKDIALSVLPELLIAAKKKEENKKKILILTATSGDTGKAAMEGFRGLSSCSVLVFYPNGGVSEIQERQMLSSSSYNVKAFAVEGDFDDCQRAVKEIFSDKNYCEKMSELGVELTSANSINIGRLIPQIVYYFDAYRQYLLKGRLNLGDKLNVVVPTGNFGDVLAAFYAKEMGLYLGRIGVASNSNKVLADFAETGTYDARRNLILTKSPSMDILISSNLERYLYLKLKDENRVAELMRDLKESKTMSFSKDYLYEAAWASEYEMSDAIKEVYEKYKYVIDPHTAIAYACEKKLGFKGACLILSTASPYKFPSAVLDSLGEKVEGDPIQDINKLSKISETKIPDQMKSVLNKQNLKKEIISKEEIRSKLDEIAIL